MVVACTQARISYNGVLDARGAADVVACTQARISYNLKNGMAKHSMLWLALRHGSVTIDRARLHVHDSCGLHSGTDQLQ